MSQPAPRSSFMQTMLFAVVIFLGLNLFFNRGPEDTRSTDQILTKMREMNAQVLDLSIAQGELGKLNNALGKEEKAAEAEKDAIKKQEVLNRIEEKRVEGQLLAADASIKAGLIRNDFNRLNTAYVTLRGFHTKMATKPVWTTKEFTMPATTTGNVAEKKVTGETMYKELVSELTVRSKKDLVWGMVPGYQLIDFLVNLTGAVPAFSYAFAAFLLAFVVRLLVFPLTQKQYKWGKQMAQLQPLIKELKEQYTDKKTGQIKDVQEFNQRSMALYKEYGINPMAGCLPMLIQLPFFWMIYQCMVHYRFEFQKGTFLWINHGNLGSSWLAPNLGETDYLLIVIYMISMVITTLLTPVSDPSNAKQQKVMGVSIAVIFSFMMFFYPLPSAFVLYWVFANVCATAQMLWVYRQPVDPIVKVNAPGGGVFPTDPKQATPSKNGQSGKTGVPVRHKPKSKKK